MEESRRKMVHLQQYSTAARNRNAIKAQAENVGERSQMKTLLIKKDPHGWEPLDRYGQHSLRLIPLKEKI